jgi:hypothetical protein
MNNETASAPESAGAELPATAPVVAKIKVVVVQQAVTEGKKKYLKNQVLEVTPERAASLGNFVKPWVDPKIEKAKKVQAPVAPAPEATAEAAPEPEPEPQPEPAPEPVQHID